LDRIALLHRVVFISLLMCMIVPTTTQAATVTTPGFNATVTATIAPTRLPKDGTAPVTLTVKGTGTRPDPAALPAYPLRYIDLKLDRHVTIDTEGLPTCTPTEVKFVTPAVARRKCGPALIGSGRADVTLPNLSEDALVSAQFDLLFFNGQSSGRPTVLMYRSYRQIPDGGIAWPVGTGRSLRVKDVGGEDSRIRTSSFAFRLGKTWQYKGERHSYLNASCVTGTVRNAITLQLDSGRVSETESQRCTKRD
jgi:hypothetical protein